MENRGNRSWVTAVAIIVVALLLFAGGYALGKLHGSRSAFTDSSVQPEAALSSASQQAASQSSGAATAQDSPAAPTAEGGSASQANASQGGTSGDASTNAPSSQAASLGESRPDYDDQPSSSASAGTYESQPASSEDAYTTSGQSPGSASAQQGGVSVDEDGTYTTKDEVALYIHTFGHLPSNFISKTKAKKAGWDSSKGNLDKVLPGMSIGGSEFYNNEGQLPDAAGRTWTECDINYEGGYRGAERIVFSNDGLVFYTSDHYKTFEQLY